MSAKPAILVTSAAGRTGAAAAVELLQKGFPVRAFVRRQDARAAALERAGADVFVGDLDDIRDLRRALDGVQRAYHCPPFTPHMLEGAMMFAAAAEEARLEVVALMSQWNPHPRHPSVASRGHWLANQIFRWAPSFDVVHINPGLFAFDYLLGLPAIVHFGALMLPFGDGLNAPPASEDIARVAAAVLADPAAHIGKSYRPTGPRLLSPSDVADILGRTLGRKVRYRDVPFRAFSRAAVALGYSLAELSQLRFYAEDLKRGAHALGAPSDHVREATGADPEPFEATMRRYLSAPRLIHPRARVGSRLEALGFLARMLVTPAPDLEAWEGARGYPRLGDPQTAMDSEEWRAAAERGRLHLIDAGHDPAPRPAAAYSLIGSDGANLAPVIPAKREARRAGIQGQGAERAANWPWIPDKPAAFRDDGVIPG